MAKGTSQEPSLNQQQPYDNILKSLLEGQEAQMLPYFLNEAVYQETLNIEVMRTLLRTDRVYKILYQGQPHILHLEFETGSDATMASRLLDYHAYLHHKYQLPVISIIVYPFRTTTAKSPLREFGHGKMLLVFHFQVLPLWKMKAKKYVQEQAIAMYALLPAMSGANAQLLNAAIDHMIEYYKDNEVALSRELKWMGIVLRRADTVPLDEKPIIEERLSMYDDLMEKDPKMQRIMQKARSEGEARGEAKGEARGEAKGLTIAIITIVKQRFPSLTKLAQQHVKSLKDVEDLQALIEQMAIAADEATARSLLNKQPVDA